MTSLAPEVWGKSWLFETHLRKDDWWNTRIACWAISVMSCNSPSFSRKARDSWLIKYLACRPPGERTVKRLRLSKALTIPDGSTVADACRRMATRRVDAALLVDSSALLCGIITDKVWFGPSVSGRRVAFIRGYLRILLYWESSSDNLGSWNCFPDLIDIQNSAMTPIL